MDYVVGFLFAFLFGIGVYFIFSNIFNVAPIQSVRSVLSINRNVKTSKHVWIYSLAQNFVSYIKLNDFTRDKTERGLRIMGSSMSAETYYAIGMVQLFLFVIGGFFLFILIPIFGLLCILVGVVRMINYAQTPDKLIRQRQRNIETELPRFVAIITQELKNNHSVVDIIEYYERYADPDLRDELQEALAGIHSGNAEVALLRLETRVGSDQLSEVVRGLIRALSGDDPVGYFEMIFNDFRVLEISNLKKESLRRPAKINKYSFFILMEVVVTIFVVLGLYAYDLLPSLL